MYAGSRHFPHDSFIPVNYYAGSGPEPQIQAFGQVYVICFVYQSLCYDVSNVYKIISHKTTQCGVGITKFKESIWLDPYSPSDAIIHHGTWTIFVHLLAGIMLIYHHWVTLLMIIPHLIFIPCTRTYKISTLKVMRQNPVKMHWQCRCIRYDVQYLHVNIQTLVDKK